MKRKMLEDLGLEKEAIDKIMEQNGNDIETAKSESKGLETKISGLEEEIKGYKGQISERDKQLTTLKKDAGATDELKKQIEELEKANKDSQKAHDDEMRKIKVDSAIEKALSASKAKNTTAVKSLLDLKDVKFAEDGTIVGLNDQIKALQSADDSKFMFDNGKPSIKGAKTGEPKDGDDSGVTAEQFAKMGYKDRLELFNTDKELYDSLVKDGE